MKEKRPFFATAIPRRGGLVIDKRGALSQEEELNIAQKYLEVITPDFAHVALLICPMQNGKILVDFANKASGNEEETRVHEDIYGVTLEPVEFSEALKLFSANGLENDFQKLNPSWAMEAASRLQEKMERIEELWSAYSKDDKIRFFWAAYRVAKEDIFIQLTGVPDEDKRAAQLLCYSVLPIALRMKLSSISNGEATQANAKLLLSEKLEYMQGKYREIPFPERWLQLGEDYRKQHESNELYRLLMLSVSEREKVYTCMHGMLGTWENVRNKREVYAAQLYDLLTKAEMMKEEHDFEDEDIDSMRVMAGQYQSSVPELYGNLINTFPFLELKPSKPDQMELKEIVQACIRFVKGKTDELPREELREQEHELQAFQKRLRKGLQAVIVDEKNYTRFVEVAFIAHQKECVQVPLGAPLSETCYYDIENLIRFLNAHKRYPKRRMLKRWHRKRWYRKLRMEMCVQYTMEVFGPYLSEQEMEKVIQDQELMLDSDWVDE